MRLSGGQITYLVCFCVWAGALLAFVFMLVLG